MMMENQRKFSLRDIDKLHQDMKLNLERREREA